MTALSACIVFEFYHLPCMTPSRETATLLRLKRKVGWIVHDEDGVPSMNRESVVAVQVSSIGMFFSRSNHQNIQ